MEGEVRVAAVLLEQLDRINEMESLMDQQQHEMKEKICEVEEYAHSESTTEDDGYFEQTR